MHKQVDFSIILQNVANIFHKDHILVISRLLIKYRPSLLILTESNVSSQFDCNILDNVFCGYKAIYNENVDRVCFLVNSSCIKHFDIMDSLVVTEECTSNIKSLYRLRSVHALYLKCHFKSFCFNILGIYRSPSANAQATTKLIEFINSKAKNCHILCGDLNIDFTKSWSKDVTNVSSNFSKFEREVITPLGLKVANNSYTRVMTYRVTDPISNLPIYRVSKTTIDPVMLNKNFLNLIDDFYTCFAFSCALDHKCVLFSTKLIIKSQFSPYSKDNPSASNILGKFLEEDKDAIMDFFSNNCNWCFDQLSVQEAYEKIESNLILLVEKFVKNTNHIRKFFRIHLPKKALSLLKLKRKVLKLYREFPCDSLLKVRNAVRNLIQRKIKKIQREYLGKLFLSADSKSSLWQVIHRINGKKAENISSPPDELMSDGVLYTGDSALQVLSKCFHAKAKHLRNIINLTTFDMSKCLKPLDKICLNHHEELDHFEAPSINCILENLGKSNNSINTHNGFSSAHVKFLAEPLANILGKFYNLILAEGSIPDVNYSFFVIKKVKRLPKIPDCEHFRPIGLSNPILRPLVDTMTSQLSKFFKNILDPYQHGYSENKGVITALMTMLEFAFVNRKSAIYLNVYDFSGAFPALNFSILLAKLAKYNIKADALKLMESYLSTRKKVQLIFPDSRAESHSEDCGVVQGCVASPLMFKLLTNDFLGPELCGNSKVLRNKFADDTKDLIASLDWNSAKANSNLAHSDLQIKARTNYLTLKPSKTKIMPILTRDNSKLDNCPTFVGDHVLILGVRFNEYFDFLPQLNFINQKLNSSFAIIKHIKRFLSVEMTLSAASKLIHADIHFSLELIFLCAPAQFDILNKTILRIGRYILPKRKNFKLLSNSYVYKQLRILPPKFLAVIQTLNFWNLQSHNPANSLLDISDEGPNRRLYSSRRSGVVTCSSANFFSPSKARLIDSLEIYRIYCNYAKLRPVRLGSLIKTKYDTHLHSVFKLTFDLQNCKLKRQFDSSLNEPCFKRRKF